MTDTIKSKLPSCRFAISLLITRKRKEGIRKKARNFNGRFLKIFDKDKIDVIANLNHDATF